MTATGDNDARCEASCATEGSNSAIAATFDTSPSMNARSAVTTPPLNANAAAEPLPEIRCSRASAPPFAFMPTLMPGKPKRASARASRTSACSASSKPAPRHAPLTAAMMGMSSEDIRS